MLEIRALEFAYAADARRMRFDCEVAQGEVLSLIGPSGSGKTTLLNLIAGFLVPARGHILLDGTAIESQPVETRPVSIVFQQYNLFPHLDVQTNVALGIEPSLRLSAEQSNAVAGALDRLGLAGLERRKPGELSGGQQQRVALARVLVRRRKILLLDEAFAALGPAQRGEMIGLVRQLVEEQGMAALLVSHQPRDALLASARTAFVDDGRIRALEDTRRLLDESRIDAVRDYLGSI
jgi:thiamine transport system ATP-binding protein